MVIGNRQIGWSQEENLLWEVSRQLDRMNSILCPCPITTTTSTTIVPTTTTTTTTVNPLVFTNYTFYNCGSCGSIEGCTDPVIFYDVWMTSECISSWPSIGCEVWLDEAGTNPFPNGSYGTNGEGCIVITDGVVIAFSCQFCVEEPNGIVIGTQTWTKCNLNVATYSDLTPIPEVTDQTQWENVTTGAWCYYDNDPANGTIYGKLYNWYAVAGIYDAASLANPALRKKLAPIGYHVPTRIEAETLFNFTDPASGGGTIIPNTAGSPLKEIGNCYWLENTDATNSTGFTAFGGGTRIPNSNEFDNLNGIGTFFTSTEVDTSKANVFYMISNDGSGFIDGTLADSKRLGLSVRLIKDPLVNAPDLFQDCDQPCGSACGGILIYYNVFMTQECIDTFPTIGCAIWDNEEGTNPFNDGTYNIGNGDCIVITGGIITNIIPK